MERRATYWQRHPLLKDGLNLAIFVIAVILGTLALNRFVFRSYNVIGHSMDDTLAQGQRILVNRLPVTAAHLVGENYVPKRGQIIVFKNPKFQTGERDEYIIKRVIAFPGERVVVADGKITVCAASYDAEGKVSCQPGSEFNPDDEFGGEPKSPTFVADPVDTVVPEGEIFVAGDNRTETAGIPNSYDSRNGLGTIPLFDIIGPAAVRIYPLNQMRTF